MSWQDELKRKFGSAEAAAAHFLPLWQKRDRKFAVKVKKPEGLANKIRDLKTGTNEGWWEKRPVLLQLIADDLGYTVEDLIGGPVALGDALTLPEFPGLKPLGSTDEPCGFGSSGWLLHQAVGGLRKEGLRHWLLAAPGSGKTLVIRYLKQRCDREFATVIAPTLEAAAESASSPLPLVVELEMQCGRSDLGALRALSRRQQPTVIMAPFVPTFSEQVDQFFRAGQQRPPRVFRHGAFPDWRILEANLPKGWRERLSLWVHLRLDSSPEETKFDHDDLLNWLATHDPNEALIDTPGELLALCAELHINGNDGVGLREMAARWTNRVLTQPAAAATDAKAWCRRVGATTFQQLATRRALGLVPLDRGLTLREWQDLVPTASPPTSTDNSGGGIVVAYLCELGLLRGFEDGALNLFPRWVVAGHAIEAVRATLETEDIEVWGRLPVEASRRTIVDTALDSLPLPALNAVIRLVLLRAETEDTLAVAGAIEATFSAAARRLLKDIRQSPRDRERLQRLAELQARLLVPEPAYRVWRVPMTRHDFDEWVADAWTFSLRLPRPPSWPDTWLLREFPGWASSICIHQIISWKFPHSSAHGTRDKAESPAHRIVAMGAEVLRRCADEEGPEKLPAILLPGLIEVASEKHWALRPEHLRDLRGSWEQDLLVARLSSTPRQEVIELLWTGAMLLATDVASVIEELTPMHGPLLGLLLDHVPERLFDETLAQRGFKTSVTAFAVLPPRLRRVTLLHWARPATGSPPSFADARNLLPAVTSEDLDVLIELTTDAERNLSAEFSTAVWRLNPPRAREETRRAIEQGRPSVEGWFWAAPESETPFLAVLAKQLDEGVAWLPRWAWARLANGGNEADTLYRIVRSHSAKP